MGKMIIAAVVIAAVFLLTGCGTGETPAAYSDADNPPALPDDSEKTLQPEPPQPPDSGESESLPGLPE